MRNKNLEKEQLISPSFQRRKKKGNEKNREEDRVNCHNPREETKRRELVFNPKLRRKKILCVPKLLTRKNERGGSKKIQSCFGKGRLHAGGEKYIERARLRGKDKKINRSQLNGERKGGR